MDVAGREFNWVDFVSRVIVNVVLYYEREKLEAERQENYWNF